jgi:hypothetical protein
MAEFRVKLLRPPEECSRFIRKTKRTYFSVQAKLQS